MNSTELLASVRRHWLGPETNLLDTDDTNILAYADAVIEEEVLPELIDVFEEYLVQEDQLAIPAAASSNQLPKVRIPNRAYNTQVRATSWRQDATGEPLDLEWINRNDKNTTRSFGRPTSAFLEADFIVLNGTDNNGVIDVAYMFRPGQLVTSDNFRQVVTVNLVTGEVTLDSATPSDWLITSSFDFHSEQSSGQIANFSLTATAVPGTIQIFFTPADIDGSVYGRRAVVQGDYLVLAGKAAQPMIPRGLHGTVVLGTALRIATAQGDTEAFQLVGQEYQNSLRRQIRVLDQRVEQKQLIVNYNSRFRRVSTLGLRRRIRFFG